MTTPAIPFVSVCSGIGAPEIAFGRHGMHSVLCSEIEAFPRAVLMHRFGAADAARAGRGNGPALWGDFSALRVRHMRRLGIPLPRVLVGGTPCQSFSVAGKRGSLGDPRGNLSLSFVRLAHALADALAGAERTADDAAPVFYAVWENVPGVLSTRDNAFGCFLGAIVGGDAAFDLPPGVDRWPDAGMVAGPRARAAWRILDAQHFRVPQRRRRVFVVVGFGAGADPVEVLLEPDGLRWDSEAGRSAPEDLAGTLAGGARGSGGYSHDDVPLTAEAYGGSNTSGAIDVATALTAHGGPHGRLDFESETFVVGSLDASGGGADENDAEQGRLVPIPFDTTQITSAANWSDPKAGDPCHPLAAGAHAPAIAWGISSDCLDRSGEGTGGTPAERAGLGIVEECSPALRAKRPNAIAFNARQDTDVYGDVAGTLDSGEPQAQAIAFSSKDYGADAGDLAPTLRAMNHDGSHANAGGQVAVAWSIMPQNSGRDYKAREVDVAQPLMAGGPVGGNQGGDYIQNATGVRRLTPRECERLQSFPDDFTLIPWRGRPAEECPDGPRYRALGNSMNAEVMAWLGGRLAAQLRRVRP